MDQTPAGSPWWHGAVLYQLYVRSWQDTNADGYGDLRGIIERLDHLSWLGVDGIWLSPTMPSPDADWGYDVSDYTGVHPELGTLADLDELIAAAAGRNMAVLLDLVPNHTSSAHPWFLDARSARDSAHRDYYVWADPAPGGGPPNNWLDATGQSAWQADDRTGQFYLHNFLASQPDLNWWQPAVHAEFGRILRFWLDRGIAGFRIDVAHGLYKDALLRDNPAAVSDSPLEGRFGFRPQYSANRPQTHEVFKEWRQIAEGYRPPALLLGETWVGDLGRLARFYGDNDELQLAFNFPFVFAGFTAAELSGVVAKTLARLPAGACPVWTASNHDVGRFATRWCGGDDRKIRLALLVLATLPGATVLYYGDEIGMADVDVPPGQQRDSMSMDSQRPDGNRDRARTPMQWTAAPGGGFSTAASGGEVSTAASGGEVSTAASGGEVSTAVSWLPAGDADACNVADQAADPDSTLSFCRSLLALRRAEFGGRIASYQPLPSPAGVWAYRAGGLLVATNFSDSPATAPFAAGEILLTTDGASPGAVTLGPWQGIIAKSPAGS